MEDLLRDLKEEGVLTTARMEAAFRAIDRADFVPPALRARAYENAPLPLGHGATISQPYTVAYMLELLQPKVGDRILDIGSGSGWQTALLAYLMTHNEVGKEVSASGKVYALEIISELVTQSKENLAQYSFIEKGVVEVFHRNAADGLPEYAPYDCIVGAAAVQKIPAAWTAQLKVGGRLLVPRHGSLVLQKKTAGGDIEEREIPGFAFVPFTNSAA